MIALAARDRVRFVLLAVFVFTAMPTVTVGAAGASEAFDQHLSAGQTLFELGRHDAAVQEFTAAAALQPINSMAHLWLGRALGRKAEKANMLQAALLVGKVRGEFERAVALDPMNIEARSDLLEFYLEAPVCFGGGIERAEQQAEAIAKLDHAQGRWAHNRIAARRNEDKVARHEDGSANPPMRP